MPFIKSYFILPFTDANLNAQYSVTVRNETETIIEQELLAGRVMSIDRAVKMAVDMLAAPPGETMAD